jgi:hypothetical protein
VDNEERNADEEDGDDDEEDEFTSVEPHCGDLMKNALSFGIVGNISQTVGLLSFCH